MVGTTVNEGMILRPMDRLILEKLEDKRNVAANLHIELDSARQYINQRMMALRDYGLVSRVGPSENSGLYEITDRGRAVIELWDWYGEDDLDFDSLVDAYVSGELDVEDLDPPT